MRSFVLITALLVSTHALAQERFTLDLEAGGAWQERNDFAVPGAGAGTLVRLDDQGPVFSSRATLTWRMNDRWSLRFLAAPFSTDSEFVADAPVSFEGETFEAGQPLRVDYRFDSYRATAMYRFGNPDRLSYRVGGTLKVRDAAIGLTNPSRSAEKTNTGLVPLLYAGVRLQGRRVSIDADVDAAAASQGRAVDAALRVERQVSDRFSLYVGGRVLEGGADNEEVYSFATFVYAFGGTRFRW